MRLDEITKATKATLLSGAATVTKTISRLLPAYDLRATQRFGKDTRSWSREDHEHHLTFWLRVKPLTGAIAGATPVTPTVTLSVRSNSRTPGDLHLASDSVEDITLHVANLNDLPKLVEDGEALLLSHFSYNKDNVDYLKKEIDTTAQGFEEALRQAIRLAKKLSASGDFSIDPFATSIRVEWEEEPHDEDEEAMIAQMGDVLKQKVKNLTNDQMIAHLSGRSRMGDRTISLGVPALQRARTGGTSRSQMLILDSAFNRLLKVSRTIS